MQSYNEKLYSDVAQAQQKRIDIINNGDRSKEPNLLGISEALDDYYFWNKLKIYCEYKAYRQIVTKNVVKYQEEDFLFIDLIVKHLKETSRVPIIRIYLQLIQLFDENINAEEQLTIFDTIIQQLNEHVISFHINNTIEIYSFLTNFCIRQRNAGHKDYTKKLFTLYLDMVNIKYGDLNNKATTISQGLFINIVTLGLGIKQKSFFRYLNLRHVEAKDTSGFKGNLEWVEQFIEIYRQKIAANDYNVVVPYCKALLEFHKQNFEKAFHLLYHAVRFRGIFINLKSKQLYLMILLELFITDAAILEEEELDIQKTIDAYRNLIRDEKNRKKELTYQVESHKIFLDYYRKLYAFYMQFQYVGSRAKDFHTKQEQLGAGILKDTKIFSYHDWLLSKVDGIS